MFLRKRPGTLLLGAVFALAACDRGEPLKVEIRGDTITSVAKLSFGGGLTSAECGFTVEAVATGSEGDTAKLTAGRIVYTMVAGGDTMITRPLDAASLASFWEGGAASVPAGSKITSVRQGISVSLPVQPLRASVSFDYTDEKGAKKTTEPFGVVCR